MLSTICIFTAIVLEEPSTLFTKIEVPGFTDVVAGTNGLALVDLNRDGILDIVVAQQPPIRSTGEIKTDLKILVGNQLRFIVSQGPGRYKESPITIDGNSGGLRSGRQSPQVPNFADFNNDGYLDLYVTRHSTGEGGVQPPANPPIGCSFLLSKGKWDSFADVSRQMDVRNERAYNRQTSFGDVNQDGWLDIAIGCDNIGNAQGGIPLQRVYVYQPNDSGYEKGRFQDIGGGEIIPDFGGFYHDSQKDKAGPDINLRDIDNDGDLDLLQNYHIDIRDPNLPYSPVNYRQGNFNWRNMLKQGAFRFEKVVSNGFANEGKLKWSKEKGRVEIEYGKAPGLPYLTTADVDNDGDQDILAVGPSDSGWSARTEYVGGRFWRNNGQFKFQEATTDLGLESLNWTYRQWYPHYGMEESDRLKRFRVTGFQVQTSGNPRVHPMDQRPYYSDCLFGDLDNDGWQDLVVLDRRETNQGTNGNTAVYLNKRGRFELVKHVDTGFQGSGIGAELADLDNDGWLDLVIMADPDNTGGGSDASRYLSRVYRNTGSNGRGNTFLRARFSGVTHAELIGARVTAWNGKTRLGTRWVHTDHAYKSSGALEVHFGLGSSRVVDLEVNLPSGKTIRFNRQSTGRFVDLNLKTKSVSKV